MRRLSPLLFLFFLALAACSSSNPATSPPDASDLDASGPFPADASISPDAPTDSSSDAPATCPRTPAAADRPRRVIVSHPFSATTGKKAPLFEVLDLSADGTLTRPVAPVIFSMGPALAAPIVFTPDGEIGLVAQDDGSVGVVHLPATGAPEVIHAAFQQGFYAHSIVVATDGTRAYILDSSTSNNGGGVYEVPIGCDGKLGTPSLVVSGGKANAMALLPTDPTKAVLAAGKAFDSPSGQDAHLVDLLSRARVGGAGAFGDSDAIASSVAVTPDGKYALIADDGVFTGDRVAVVALTPQIAPVSVLHTPFPAAVVISPFNNAAIVLNDDSTDEIHVMTYDAANSAAPFAITGELPYVFGKPQIPVTASTIDRGKLKGTVFIGENLAVRQLTFNAGGTVSDTAKLSLGAGNTSIVGVVGVQP